MRIALLSDIHGNPIALDAVLKDIEGQRGIDTYWILGDLVALGYDPIGVLERLSKLSNVGYVRGNTDRYVVTGDRPGPKRDQVELDLSLLDLFISVEKGFTWTQGAIAAAGWFEWLSALPFEQRTVLPDGTRLLGVHASLLRDDRGFHQRLSDGEILGLFPNCEAELIFAGHTHRVADIKEDGRHFINLGSVSNPDASDFRASYVILDADESGYQVNRRRVEYDYQRVIESIRQSHHPNVDFLSGFFTAGS